MLLSKGHCDKHNRDWMIFGCSMCQFESIIKQHENCNCEWCRGMEELAQMVHDNRVPTLQEAK